AAERDSGVRIRTEVLMSLEVGKPRCDLCGSREGSCENVLRDLFERKFMSLPIQRVDDFVEAHEITGEGQILAIACLVQVCERSGNDATEFADVTHVNAAHRGVDRKRPAQG